MKTRLFASAGLLVLLLARCGGGGSDAGLRAPDESAPASGDDVLKTPDVEAAPEGGVNRPRDGTYAYAYESRQTNAATPDATPRRSAPGAEFTSKVKTEGDVVTTADSTSEGPAVSTKRQRWEDDRVLELSFELRANDTTAGCEFDEPIEVLRIPIEEEKLPTQDYDGSGTSCNGKRTIEVQGREDVLDDAGVTWSTWRIETETIITLTGLTQKNTDTRWFSPDLGKEVKFEGITEYIDPEGKVAVRAEQTVLLTSIPGLGH